ncbi:hypothetical protein MAP00_008008 [Monascus purpureus]|nr:hypothetical protein MAP00_008008 [Monascus purpureus]
MQSTLQQHPAYKTVHKQLTKMDSQLTSKSLHNRINTDISQLLQRFENIMATATVENSNHASTAVETYQLDVESTALIRAAEDILSLTRSMKEAWLFGKLNTLGEDERDVKRREGLERDALAVQKAAFGEGESRGGLLRGGRGFFLPFMDLMPVCFFIWFTVFGWYNFRCDGVLFFPVGLVYGICWLVELWYSYF